MLHRVAFVRTDISEEMQNLHQQGDKNLWARNNISNKQQPTYAAKKYYVRILRSVRQLLITDNVVPGSWILATLMREVLRSSETLVLTRATRRYIPEDDILQSYRRENFKSDIHILYPQNCRALWLNWIFEVEINIYHIKWREHHTPHEP
jgi:hypothetical protein